MGNIDVIHIPVDLTSVRAIRQAIRRLDNVRYEYVQTMPHGQGNRNAGGRIMDIRTRKGKTLVQFLETEVWEYVIQGAKFVW